jgi:hypothetical protein
VKKFKSALGFINYHIFWTGFVFVRTRNILEGTRLHFRKIIDVYGHNDKSKIWSGVNSGIYYRKKRLNKKQRLLRFLFMPVWIHMIKTVNKQNKDSRTKAMNRIFNNANHGRGVV